MSRILIELDKQSAEFRLGFYAAMDMLDGADRIQVLESPKNREWIHLEMEDDEDDRTFHLHRGRMKMKKLGAVL